MPCVNVPRAGIRQIARDPGIGEEHADLLAELAVKHGVWKIIEDEE